MRIGSSPDRRRRLAADAALLGAALMLSWLEAVVPLGGWIPLPGAKLGLANFAVLLAAERYSAADAAAVSFARVAVAALLFGSVTSFAFSLSGAILAWAALALLCRFRPPMSWIGVSLLCAAAHNMGQLLCAALWLHEAALLSYAPALLLFAAASGTLTGIPVNLISARLGRRERIA